MKECIYCCHLKEETLFVPSKNICKKCNYKRVKEWRKQNPDHVREKNRIWQRQWRAKNKDRSKNKHLIYKYGLTLDEYNKMLKDQNGQCCICKTKDSGNKDWSVDHCHKTNKIRGILCHWCNTLLGHAKDNTIILENAIKYLDRNKKV